MAVLTFPSVLPDTLSWRLVDRTQIHESPLSGKIQTLELPGPYWMVNMSFQAHNRDVRYILESFIVQLRGAAGSFFLYNHARTISRGVATGLPLVDGSLSTKTAINVKGFTPSITGILKEGDFISIGQEVKVVTADVDSDVSGNCVVTIEPAMRNDAVADSPIEVQNAKGIFKLLPGSSPSFSYTTVLTSLSLSCREA